MDNLNYVKERFEGCFDVKYRDVKTIIGDGTLVFIDDLCNGQWMMEYLILPLRGFGELNKPSPFKSISEGVLLPSTHSGPSHLIATDD